MDSFLKNECDLNYFHDNKYYRKKCNSCGAYYWTLDKNSKFCGDQPCVKFSFIGNPLGKKPLSLTEVRETFLSFFEKKNHKRHAFLDKKDADSCIEGNACIYLGMLITQYIKDLEMIISGK